MRLVVVQETDWLQRGPHQQHHLFERLSARGHEVIVVDFEILYAPWPNAPLVAPRMEWSDVSRVNPEARVRVIRPAIVRLPGLARITSLVTFYRELARIVRSFRPDLIVNYAISTGVSALAIARSQRIPFVMHVIDALHTLAPHKWIWPLARSFEALLLRNADATIYINEELKDYGVTLGARRQAACTVRTGVDLERFHPSRDANEIRREWSIAPDAVLLVFIGWLYHFSGVDTIMHMLPDMPTTLKMLVVGSGEAESKLWALRESLGLHDRVVFTGRQEYESMPDFMTAADVCLMCSELNPVTRHIVPIKTFEYLACGRPVLASELPGVMREVPPGNGIIYAPKNELLPALQRLLDPDARAREGRKARAYAQKHCDWPKLTDRFEQVLSSVIAQEK
ncbi:MAG TPA: glycosyltransferase family 4 protein [Anaerolineales bacterium]|jgi:glycosyltransferase involved in cell wall biosynthesis|nr:glycosyltransferase family 4 protein [Anaerolineales bacterium]